METPMCVFQSVPPSQDKHYIVWLDKVQNKRKKLWEYLGIFDVIQLSRTDHMYNLAMLLDSILFWEGLKKTFQFPYGMLMPTLFDVSTITGLRHISETFTPIVETINEFIFERFNFKNYITDHHKKNIEEVSDQEHIAFLTLQLSYYLFCLSSLQIAKKYVPLAI